MGDVLYYTVEMLFWRRKIGGKLQAMLQNVDLKEALVHHVAEFKNDEPVEARKAAFGHFQNVVDVLYDGIGKTYSTTEQAYADLQYYFDSQNSVELLSSDVHKRFRVSDDILNGISIYAIVDVELSKPIQSSKILIHTIRLTDHETTYEDAAHECLSGLEKECDNYEKRGYDYGNQLEFIVLADGSTKAILKSPFEWASYTN